MHCEIYDTTGDHNFKIPAISHILQFHIYLFSPLICLSADPVLTDRLCQWCILPLRHDIYKITLTALRSALKQWAENFEQVYLMIYAARKPWRLIKSVFILNTFVLFSCSCGCGICFHLGLLIGCIFFGKIIVNNHCKYPISAVPALPLKLELLSKSLVFSCCSGLIAFKSNLFP